MRRIIYSVAMSLDGYIAGPKGEYDWIIMDPDIDFVAIGSQFDTLLMGRKTYLPMAGTGGGAGGPFAAMSIVVGSKTLLPADHPKATIVPNLDGPFLDQLKMKPGKDIWLFGGGELFRSLLELGQVDGVSVAIIPVLVGGGIPFLPSPAVRTKLELVKHHRYQKSGIVSLEYHVKGPGNMKGRSRQKAQ